MGTVLGRGGGGWDRMRIRIWIWIWIRCGIFLSKCPRDILANKKRLLFYDIDTDMDMIYYCPSVQEIY